MIIRSEHTADAAAIKAVTKAAFATAPHSDQTEAEIIDALRAADALTISLVAEDKEKITGHAAFSPVTINGNDMGWYGLGPVSVDPNHQKSGIGSALINAGLEQLKSIKANGCVVLGDPNFYQRFGFKADKGLVLPNVQADYFMRLVLGDTASGEVAYHAGFGE
ncbi:MAG: GNAT family N-acetyltransferase [Pikeienuella sp.]